MGVYRFLLPAVVVLSHVGGLSWVTGRVAVFAFYCISRFLFWHVRRFECGPSSRTRPWKARRVSISTNT